MALRKFVGKPRKSALPNGPPGSAGDTEAEVELTVHKDFAAPHVALKVGTADAVKLLVVPGLVAEKEPNNGFATAQAVTVPLALHGTIEKPRDVDVYRFTGRKGERLRIQITARNLGSLLDATVTLYDENRRIVESCDDVGGDTDPSFPVVLPRDGVYYLSVIDSHDLGGPGFAYLLSVTK